MNHGRDSLPEGDRDDGIARLIRLAGPRPASRSARFERARAATLAHGRRVWRRRVARRWAWGGFAGAAALAGLALVLRGGVVGSRARPEIFGRVEMPPASGREAARLVRTGERLTTPDEGGLALRTPDGSVVRIDRATRVRIEGLALLELEEGALYVDTGPPGASLIVRTRLGEVRHLGTRYEVRVDPASLRIRVREGRVRLDETDRREDLPAGTEIEVEDSGARRRGTIPSHGPEWSWAEALAPRLEIDGRTAREFLDWMARERGLTLAFADPATARQADGIVLRGSIAGSTLDEALEAVLPTCGLRHRIADGVLAVRDETSDGPSR